MINYILQVLIFQTLFLAVYDLFLKKETFFQWNRFYLILTSILAYIIPFIKINSIGNYVKEKFILSEIIKNPEIIFLNQITINKQTSALTLENLYLLGFVIMTILFLFKIMQIIKKINTNKVIKKADYFLVILKKGNNAFSFFNYIFLGETVYQKEHQEVLKHELIHVKQKHSLDLLFFEIQKIMFWINPFSYLFQNRISTLHEYIADSKTMKTTNKTSFFENLLHQIFNVEKITFVNNYYKQSLLKKRIIMATKNKSKQILKMKYLLILPLLFVMLIITSCNGQKNKKNAETKTIPPLPLNEVFEEKNSSFSTIDKTPVYKGCENFTDNESLKKCFQKSISNHIAQHFNSKLVNSLGLKVGKKKINTKFIINEKGTIENIKVSELEHNKTTNKVKMKNVHLKLENEVKRIINLMPQMKAGEQNGKPVKVSYNLPIAFVIEK